MNNKYREKDILRDVEAYIDSTYNQHYVGEHGIQTFDVWSALDIAPEVCRGTAIKYLMRYGKKEGYNKKDLLKAIHYIILLMYFSETSDHTNKIKNLVEQGTIK